MKRLLREPLLHFFVLGVALFVLYGWANRNGFSGPTEIVVSREQIDSLQSQFRRVWQRPPTAEESQRLVDSWVREEIYYREGLAMGLDRDDPIIRRRINQKFEFIIDAATPAAPTTRELQAWLDQHPDTYRVEPVYTLQQVYFEPASHGERLESDIVKARLALQRGREFTGDSTMLPSNLQGSASEVTRTFGSVFEESLRTLPTGEWQGPVRSGFGLHLVKLTARDEGRAATLQDVRDAVERDLLHARTEDANEAYYQKLRAGYTVRIDQERGTGDARGERESAEGGQHF